MPDEITLDKEVFKALAGETRITILKSLRARRKTQSELAKEVSIAAPTVKEHVDILQKAGLVREIDDGHKWKYIELTLKGKSILDPPADKKILVLLATSLVGILGSAYFVQAQIQQYIQAAAFNYSLANVTLAAEATAPVPVQPFAQPLADTAMKAAAGATTNTATTIVSNAAGVAADGTIRSMVGDRIAESASATTAPATDAAIQAAKQAAVQAAGSVATNPSTPPVATKAATLAAHASLQALPALPWVELAFLLVCLFVFGACVGMWIRQTYN